MKRRRSNNEVPRLVVEEKDPDNVVGNLSKGTQVGNG